MTIDISTWHFITVIPKTLTVFMAGFVGALAFDPTWSTGNIITIGVVVVGGLTTFYGIVAKLTGAQQKQDQALELMAAHQEAAMGLMNQIGRASCRERV